MGLLGRLRDLARPKSATITLTKRKSKDLETYEKYIPIFSIPSCVKSRLDSFKSLDYGLSIILVIFSASTDHLPVYNVVFMTIV